MRPDHLLWTMLRSHSEQSLAQLSALTSNQSLNNPGPPALQTFISAALSSDEGICSTTHGSPWPQAVRKACFERTGFPSHVVAQTLLARLSSNSRRFPLRPVDLGSSKGANSALAWTLEGVTASLSTGPVPGPATVGE